MKRFGVIGAIVGTALFVLVVVLAGGGGEKADVAADREPVATTQSRQQTGAQTGVPTGATARAGLQAANPRRKVGGPHDDPVPILMYHVTKSAPPGTAYPELWVSVGDFKGQMDWLADHGYTGITMTQLFDYWDDGYALPKKPVVISFDDGYASHSRNARPVLAKHGWPGVLFLELNNVGSPETGFTAKNVKKLIEFGWEIDSHTVSHPDLTQSSPADVARELTASRRQIKRMFGQPAEFFCYPAGKYDDAVVAAVEKAGYRGATTVDDGLANPAKPYELARIRIDAADGVSGFAAKLQRAGG